jgi:hypothetical protein
MFNMAKITIDGDEDCFEARANQMAMDDEGSIEHSARNTNDAMTKSMMGTGANALDSRLAVVDNGRHQRSCISRCRWTRQNVVRHEQPRILLLRPGGRQEDQNIHTAKKGKTRKAKAYGIAAGSVPTLSNLETREPGPRTLSCTRLTM